MKLAIIADTHIGQRLQDFPQLFLELLDSPDVIIHSGDFTNVYALETIAALADTFYGVYGNMDSPAVKDMLPRELRFELNSVSFGLIHGWGAGWDLHNRVYDHFKSDRPRIIIFGHSHIPFRQNFGTTLLLNPGSVSGNLFSDKGSFLLMELSEDGEFEIVKREFEI